MKTSMKKPVAPWLVAGSLALTTAFLGSTMVAQAAESGNPAFLKKAIQIDMAEVDAGKLAQQKAPDQVVKDYGQMLVDDHSKHETGLKSLAKTEGVSVPNEPEDAAQREAAKLKQLSGKAFEQEFLTHMVQGHRKAIAAYQEAAKSGTDDVAKMATATLPTLKKHLEKAQTLMKQVGEQTAN